MYNETDRQIEKWSKIVYIVIAQTTPACFILPIFVYSLIEYFTTDLGTDAFELPLPVWCVKNFIDSSMLYICYEN